MRNLFPFPGSLYTMLSNHKHYLVIICKLKIIPRSIHNIHTLQLLGWLEEKLPASGKLLSPEVTGIIAPLYSALEDRSGDVRKKAQVVLPLFMAHVSYDTMLKQTGKLKVCVCVCVQLWFLICSIMVMQLVL